MAPFYIDCALISLFAVAALIECWRESFRVAGFSRQFAGLVTFIAIVLLSISGMHEVPNHAAVSLQQYLQSPGASSTFISHIPFPGRFLFAVMSVGVFFGGVMFCPSAPLVKVRMSRVFGMQALLLALILVESVTLFLLLGIVLILGFIFSVRYHCRTVEEDDQRFIRSASFTRYQALTIGCLAGSLLLRVGHAVGVLPASDVVWGIDLGLLCLASAISIGLFPFHGWVLPFLGSPRTTVFLQMLSIQTGLLFFFRLYAPIVAAHHDLTVLFSAVPAIGILYAALLFFGEHRLKRIPGYLYLSHVCLMAISAVALGSMGMTASMLDGVNTLVSTLGLVGVCALLTSRFGVRGVLVPTGLGGLFPEIAVCYLVCVLSLVSFPGTLGFIEEEVLLGQGIGDHNVLVAVVAIALTLNGFSSFRLFARVFLGQPIWEQDTETGLLVRERVVIYGILAVIILNGLAPSFLVDSLSRMAGQ